MIKSGLQPILKDARDFDYHKTYGSALQPTLPDTYSVSQGWFPNQEIADNSFTPPVPPLPYGCTEWTPCVVCGDEDQRRYNPEYLENLIHANASGGGQIRTALGAIVKNGLQADDGTISKNHQGYFNVNPQGNIDWFDAVRLALYSTYNEKRAVIIGSYFYASWETNGILPAPSGNKSLHCWSVEGWTTVNSQPYLQCNFLIGIDYNSCLMSRPIFNQIMSEPYCAAFTIEKDIPGVVQTVDMSIIDRLINYVRSLWNL